MSAVTRAGRGSPGGVARWSAIGAAADEVDHRVRQVQVDGDPRVAGDFLRGRPGAGSVHHVAFRAADDAAQAAMVERLRGEHAIEATEQTDRTYFRSVYFREPGGVLFEIATDVPGFAVDEAPGHLGEALKLPAQYEPHRAAIEAALPELGDAARSAA